MGKKVTLHVDIRDILELEGNRWMSTSELADRVNHRGRYRKRDGSSVSRFQIHGRTRNYSRLFERKGSLVRVIPEQAVVAPMVDPLVAHDAHEGCAHTPARLPRWIPGWRTSVNRPTFRRDSRWGWGSKSVWRLLNSVQIFDSRSAASARVADSLAKQKRM